MIEKDKYSLVLSESNRCIDQIISSPAKRKVVVAGPGTGKTYLFKKIIGSKTNCLTLTFVNALVEELALELYGLSEVKTLHGFALKQLASISPNDTLRIFPNLPRIISEDAEILLSTPINFKSLFQTDSLNQNEHSFYKSRRRYYGNYFGFEDIVWSLNQYFDQDKDRIPRYDLLLVDEYQDFNASEVRLIELLSEKSPVLIVGDDDQVS